ncbi:rna polymerase sigma factor region 3/4 [Lucifera butyrica]|uniref:Rna polymerase sigma factor region 3/4 n=1 Tax=Lucifera butyrica TaxID=1351585 RepID=A0A498RKC7_9FIRM|nr:sugar-binding transcriptional regulator [Lucifera butyrica]VBB09498.1 rna polymerase sigma factor region 3/4 [Lucifera butyrica]
MITTDRRMLIKVAHMYYIENMNQNEIGNRLGINRTTVSKYLKKAVLSGVVQFTVVDDLGSSLETALEKKFGLKEVYIVPSASKLDEVKNNLGKAGIKLLNRIISDGDIVGFAWGSTIGALARFASLEKWNEVKAEMIPLVGGPENLDSEFHVNTIIYKIGQAFKAQSHYLYAPAITGSAVIRAAIMQDMNCRKIVKMWDEISIAVVGIGVPVQSSNLVWTGSVGREYIEQLNDAGVVGDICSRFYDIHGNVVDTELKDRTIAIDLEKLKKVKYSVGIAASPEKVPAIYGALKGKFINVLISDEQTAKRLLDFDSKG